MDLEKNKTKEVKNLQQEIAEKVVEGIKLAGKSKKEWIRAILVKKNDKPLSGKYTFITKNPGPLSDGFFWPTEGPPLWGPPGARFLFFPPPQTLTISNSQL